MAGCSILILDNYSSAIATVGGGFFAGILIGWVIKKVTKLFVFIAALFLAGLAYLQYQQIALINWDRLEQASEGLVNTLVNASTKMIDGGNPEMAELAIKNFDIPLTSSISIGFAIGFMKG
jgi:uncharacterized membrane protein (Fun14 family)